MGKAHGFVKFEKDKDEPGESVYDVFNKKDDELGKIMWHHRWKKHVFEPYMDTYFDNKCLTQISEFLIELDKKYPNGLIS